MTSTVQYVSGTVQRVNEKLNQSPELVNKDPYGEGWFVIMKLEDFENDRQNLLQAQDYFEVLKRKVETERRKLGKKGV